MTNQIDYSSKKWADDVARRLFVAKANVADAADVLRRLILDMDADGHDWDRGPHAPPVEDIQSLLRIATSLLTQQASSWEGYAHHRGSR